MKFVVRSRIEAPAAEVFAWHSRPGAFERLLPPWEKTAVLENPGLRPGGRLVLRLGSGLYPRRWVLLIRDVQEGRQFVAEQMEGPFSRWVHEHCFEPDAGVCFLQDRIHCALPLGPLGRLAEGTLRERLRREFRYRHAVIQGDLERHRTAAGQGRLRVLVTGSSGLVGSALVDFLSSGGHKVSRLLRGAAREPGGLTWDPEAGKLEAGALEGFDAVVHLAGESLASRRWTDARKELILQSRVRGTRLLCEALAGLKRPPRVLVSASATGFYGDRAGQALDETSGPGEGFLARVCEEWEDAVAPARSHGIRVVSLRLGMVLTPAGGALGAWLPAFRLGLGGPIGGGRQSVSWISLDDLLGAVHYAIFTDSLFGPVNAVSPGFVSNAEFSRVLARVLGRPAALAIPGVAVRAAFGEMGSALLLAGAPVRPRRLLETGFRFLHPDLEGALRHLLGRTGD